MKATTAPSATVATDGTARLLRFTEGDPKGAPILLVPSLINRWYVLDLRPETSVVRSLCAQGFDVYCLDWGEPNDEDRYLTWDDVVARLLRMRRKVSRLRPGMPLGLLGYCVGATLSSIATALEPQGVDAFVNLAGPIDFSKAGFLGEMTNPRWFDPEAIASAGNMSAPMMQAGFVSLRPTSQLSKLVTLADRIHDEARRESFLALDGWASDNIAFPAAAYATYIRELYQDNNLISGAHHVLGRRVELGQISCPLLTVTTKKDTICPPAAALALNAAVGSSDLSELSIPGGHVGAVVGDQAKETLYPQLALFFKERLCNSIN